MADYFGFCGQPVFELVSGLEPAMLGTVVRRFCDHVLARVRIWRRLGQRL